MVDQPWKEFQAKLKKNGANSVYAAREILVQDFLQLERTRSLSHDGSELTSGDKIPTRRSMQECQQSSVSSNISSHSISRTCSSEYLPRQECIGVQRRESIGVPRRESIGGSLTIAQLLTESLPWMDSKQGTSVEFNRRKDDFESYVLAVTGRGQPQLPRRRVQRRFSLDSFTVNFNENMFTSLAGKSRSSSLDLATGNAQR